jgi:hypothetical protein
MGSLRWEPTIKLWFTQLGGLRTFSTELNEDGFFGMKTAFSNRLNGDGFFDWVE